VGAVVAAFLDAQGHDVVGFDVTMGRDMLCLPDLAGAMAGCRAVVHLAALPGPKRESPERVVSANVQGTWNVLKAAVDQGIDRIVYMSSVAALGVFGGQRPPDYLPIDDRHECRPSTPYGISKRLCEELCRCYANRFGMTVICFRPPGVWQQDTYHAVWRTRKANPGCERQPGWEYGTFIDARDLAAAVGAALTCDFEGYGCFLVAAADIVTCGPTSRELARFARPQVEWRGGIEYEEDPFLSLLDTSKARTVLDWRPRFSWQGFLRTVPAA